MEWGSGGGANLAAVAPYATTLYAVDVSRKNLDETCRQIEGLGEVSCTPLPVDERPADVAAHVSEPLDLFFSSGVFHQLPSKDYASAVLRTAFAIMKPGALGYIRIRFDDGNPKFAPQGAHRYREHHVFAMSWDLTEFWAELKSAGFKLVKIANLETRFNFIAFYFQK